MVEINIAYRGNLRCEATHGPSGVKLSTDAPKDNQGQGLSFSPTDLLATALGTCMLTILGISAKKHNLDLPGAEVRVTKEMTTTPPRRVATLTVEFRLPDSIPLDKRQALENAARACPVHHSLHPDVVTPITFVYE
jgi:putative redox protein